MSKIGKHALEEMERIGAEDVYELEEAMRLDELKHFTVEELQAEIDSRATGTLEMPGYFKAMSNASLGFFGEDPRGDFSGATEGDR